MDRRTLHMFREYYILTTFTFAMSSPSVCRLTVTFVHTTQAIEIFGNISTPFGTMATRWHPGKILRTSS